MKPWEEWMLSLGGNLKGKCRDITAEMKKLFPELTLVRGHYHCPLSGRVTHWWLLDPEGNIVDPTAKQFPSNGQGEYEPWDEKLDEPTGKCLNCGSYCYGGSFCCSSKCYSAFVLSIGVKNK